MPLELAVAAGTLLLALVLVCTRAFRGRPSAPDMGPEPAWRFVDGMIALHIDELVAAWLENGGAAEADQRGPFTREIESFIGTVLMRACSSAMDDADLRDELRELLVLEREHVYERILARIEQRLADTPSA